MSPYLQSLATTPAELARAGFYFEKPVPVPPRPGKPRGDPNIELAALEYAELYKSGKPASGVLKNLATKYNVKAHSVSTRFTRMTSQ